MMTVEEAITGRHCYRAFLPKPVPRELIARSQRSISMQIANS